MVSNIFDTILCNPLSALKTSQFIFTSFIFKLCHFSTSAHKLISYPILPTSLRCLIHFNIVMRLPTHYFLSSYLLAYHSTFQLLTAIAVNAYRFTLILLSFVSWTSWKFTLLIMSYLYMPPVPCPVSGVRMIHIKLQYSLLIVVHKSSTDMIVIKVVIIFYNLFN